MKDFDEDVRRERSEKDRTFKLGGEEFKHKAGVRPEALNEYLETRRDEDDSTIAGRVDTLIEAFLEPSFEGDDPVARWKAMRETDQHEFGAVTLRDMLNVVDWLTEQVTGRPPTRSGSSQTGDSQTGGTSTAGSSSPEERT